MSRGLKNEAEVSGVALMRLRKRVAFERFLARLAASESGGWVLKGAFALELRLGLRTRTTKDIDLGRADDEEAATEHLNAATGVDHGDFFDFEVRRTPALDAATGFHAVRYTVRADLATTFEQRTRQPLPKVVPPPPSSWARPYAELAREVGIAMDIDAGHAAAAHLLDPVLGSDAEGFGTRKHGAGVSGWQIAERPTQTNGATKHRLRRRSRVFP